MCWPKEEEECMDTRNPQVPKISAQGPVFATSSATGTCTSTRQVPAINAQGTVFATTSATGTCSSLNSLKELNIFNSFKELRLLQVPVAEVVAKTVP